MDVILIHQAGRIQSSLKQTGSVASYLSILRQILPKPEGMCMQSAIWFANKLLPYDGFS